MHNIEDIGKLLLGTHREKLERLTPSQYSEKYCDMTGRSSVPGLYRFENSPYNREIINRFDEDDPTKKITIIKVPQSGLSAVFENLLCWVIDQSPCPMMMLQGDKDLSDEMVSKRIDTAIDNAGLRHKIQANTKKLKNKRSGDTMTSKEFLGGNVTFGSSNNKKNFRQKSIKIGILDDADAAKGEDEKEGDMLSLFSKRFTWYANRGKKECVCSTPTIKGNSVIEKAFNLSDQREYEMPCPECGEFIVLEFSKRIDKEKFGLIFKIDKHHRLVEDSVEYRCYKCGSHFKEKHKYEMLNNGIWVPTNESKSEPFHAGYHIGGLMLPPGTLTWKDQAREFINCYPQGFGQAPDVSNLKVFVNQVEGKSYEDRGMDIKSSHLQKNCREYQAGTVPCEQSRADGNGDIILITLACDINGFIKGINSDDRDDLRLDWEIVAHTENKSTYSINHGSIGTFQRSLSEKGRICYSIRHDAEHSVWPLLYDLIATPLPTDDDKEMFISVIGIDEGFGQTYARQFVEQFAPNTAWTIKGDGEIKSTSSDRDMPYCKKSTSYSRALNVVVNKVKDDLYRYMQLPWNREREQPQNFMNFPLPEKGKYTYKSYFIEYEGETRKVNVSKKNKEIAFMWEKKQTVSRNHYWDCRVYNLTLADITCRNMCKEYGLEFDWINFVMLMKNLG